MHRRHGRRWAAPIAVFVSAVCALAPSARGQRARTPTPTAEPVQREAFERYRRATEARLHALERALEARTEAEAGAEAHAGDDLAALRAAAVGIEIVAVHDAQADVARWAGCPVWREMPPLDLWDVCVVTDLVSPQETYQRLVEAVGVERVLVPDVLGINRKAETA